MGAIKQLIKKDYKSPSGYKDIDPKSFTDAIKDRKTKETVEVLIARNNFIFLPYSGSVGDTRLLLDEKFRRKGLWVGYITQDKNYVVEYYNNDLIEDDYWKNDKYWISYNNVRCNNVTNRLNFKSGNEWLDADGNPSSIKRSGSTAERPVPNSVGFVYFDTSLGKPIYAKTISTGEETTVVWVDAMGIEV